MDDCDWDGSTIDGYSSIRKVYIISFDTFFYKRACRYSNLVIIWEDILFGTLALSISKIVIISKKLLIIKSKINFIDIISIKYIYNVYYKV